MKSRNALTLEDEQSQLFVSFVYFVVKKKELTRELTRERLQIFYDI